MTAPGAGMAGAVLVGDGQHSTLIAAGEDDVQPLHDVRQVDVSGETVGAFSRTNRTLGMVH